MAEPQFVIVGYVHDWPVSSYGRRLKFENLSDPDEYYTSDCIYSDGVFSATVVGNQSYRVYARVVVGGVAVWEAVWSPHPVHIVGSSGTKRICVTLEDLTDGGLKSVERVFTNVEPEEAIQHYLDEVRGQDDYIFSFTWSEQRCHSGERTNTIVTDALVGRVTGEGEPAEDDDLREGS